MEKFAVDLDKVLDDFELNEDRAERFAAKNKTPPKQQQQQQPLLGRVNARSSSKWESYSRPELSERVRRINLVDADFAPQPIPAPAVRLPDSAHNGTTVLQGNNDGSISVQAGQSQHSFEYWPQKEAGFPKPLLSEEVTQPKDETVAETSSEESSRAGAILNSVEDHSSGVEDKNVDITPESIIVNNESHLVGLENCIRDTDVLVEEQEVEFISQESGRGTAASAALDEDKVEYVTETSQAVPDSVGGHSSELVSVPATLHNSNATVLIEESLDTCNEDSLCGQSELSDHDHPSELNHEDGNSENVPLDEEETGRVEVSLVESREVERDVRLVKAAADINVESDVPEVKPISFQLDEDLSDSEVNRYLEELEEEESKDSDESSNENDANEVSSSVQEDEGNVEEAEPMDESQEVETDEVEDEEVIPKGTSSKERSEKPVLDDSSPKRSVVTKVQTNSADSTVEEGNLGTGMESEALTDESNMECVKEVVPSENVVEEKAMSGEDKGCKVEDIEGMEEVLEKRSNVRKTVEDSRVESWVVEGNGKLLEGASVNDRVSAASKSSESVSVTKQESGSGMPVRPDTLSISAMVGSAGNSSVDEEDSIPIPLVLGPPGATPANPRPPSDIGARMPANEIPVKLEAKVQAETELPQEHPSHQSTSSRLESDSMSEAVVTGDVADLQKRSEQIPVSAPEESLNHEIGDHKHPEDDRPEVPDSCEDSTPDSGDGTPLPGEIPSGNELDEQNVASGVASSSEFQDSAASSSPNEEAGCTALALGDVAPFWVPDADAPSCMSCAAKFTLIKRRHHCRACGKVLCSKCCSSKARLTYMNHSEARVCLPCFGILQEAASGGISPTGGGRYHPSHGGEEGTSSDHSPRRRHTRPDPNNPMEYCSTVPPLEQVGERARAPPPTVMVPVGVLKREGSARSKGEAKQVMFSDGIRPGGELTELDRSPTGMSGPSKSPALMAVQRKIANRLGKRMPGVVPPGPVISGPMSQLPTVASRIPDDALPPLVDKSTGSCVGGGEYNFEEGPDLEKLMETLRDDSEPPVAFALSKNFFVLVKIITLDCCVNRTVWSFTTRGMRCVGQDEVIVLLEWLPTDKGPPRDIFCHLGALYEQAAKGNTVTELGHSTIQGMFLGSHNHGGFLYIRATFQCLRRLPLPPPPFLFGLLLHRMETPWAKVFPIRVMLRLGAEFRYYPCPLVGIRGREPVYQQIGHTIMNLLSDFRNFTYVIPSVRGMVIHMEERQSSILLPRNRLSQVERALDDSDDHVLALAASFSTTADSHLVCVQGESGDASTGSNHYHTQAINIQNKPRKVTGASFVVFNGALKASSKLTAKSSIVEDGLMVQVLPDTLANLRTSLRNGEDFVIPCGPVTPVTPTVQQPSNDGDGTPAAPSQPVPDEVVVIKWVDDDKNFNIGVKSPIDGMALDGIPSIRVHNGTNYISDTKFIRWTEVFLVQCAEVPGGRNETMDVSRISESIAHAVCLALHPYLDLLWSHALTLIAVRATLGPDSEGYEAGCGGSKLPPIYMNGLDNQLVGVLHRIEARPRDGNLVLELLFHLMEL